MVYIITDSTASVPVTAAVEYGERLKVLQLKVLIDGKDVAEGQLAQQEIFDYVSRTNEHPKTSQPAPGEVQAVFDEITAKGGTAVGIFLSGGLSGTCSNISKMAREKYRGKVYVIDSRSSSAGEWNLVRQALALAAEGRTAAEIYETITGIVKKNNLYIIADTLSYLKRGGRIGGAAAFVGTLLGIRPVITVDTGVVEVLDKVRTQKRAFQRVVEQIKSLGPCAWYGISHNNAPDLAENMAGLLRSECGIENIEISGNGAVLGVHVGPRAIAVFAQRK